jgi:flagellar protein FlaJ
MYIMDFTEAYKKASLRAFGHTADRMIPTFESIRPHLKGSGIGMFLRTWVSIILLSVIISYALSLALALAFSLIFLFSLELLIYTVAFVPILTAALVFVVFYVYPMQKSRSIEKRIEIDLPFALAHMSAIASSGIPPEFMFELLIGFEEYRAISTQARMVVRNIKTFGMSSVAAINDVAERTPSAAFKQILGGMAITIEKGGDMVRYLNSMAKTALFDYRLKREKYLKTLSTYADIYTALLVAAPLMMLAILGVMSIIGGEVLGMTIGDVILLITWGMLPLLNVVFLLFVHITYPGV